MATLTTLLSEVYSHPKEDSEANRTDPSPSTNDHIQTAVASTNAGSLPTSPHSPISSEAADCDTADTQGWPSVLTSSSTLASNTTLPSNPTNHVPRAPDDLDNADFDEILASGSWDFDCEKDVVLKGSCSAGTSGEPSPEHTHGASESTTGGQHCSCRELIQDTSSGGDGVDMVESDGAVQRSSSLAPDTPTPPPRGSGDSEATGLCERLSSSLRAVQPGSCELLDVSEFEEDSSCVELGSESDVTAAHEPREDSGGSWGDGGDPVCQGRHIEESSQRGQ